MWKSYQFSWNRDICTQRICKPKSHDHFSTFQNHWRLAGVTRRCTQSHQVFPRSTQPDPPLDLHAHAHPSTEHITQLHLISLNHPCLPNFAHPCLYMHKLPNTHPYICMHSYTCPLNVSIPTWSTWPIHPHPSLPTIAYICPNLATPTHITLNSVRTRKATH